MTQPILIDPLIVIALIVASTVFAFLALLGLGLGGPVIRGRMPGDGAFYLLYGTITKFGYTRDVIGNTLRFKLGKSKLSFIVNPEHRTYLWGKPLYILSIEYGTSVHPSMLAILSALKELGKEDMIKNYMDLNRDYALLLNALQSTTDPEEREKIEKALQTIENKISELEGNMRAFVDKNAQVVEIKQNMKLEELKSDKRVLVVRQLDPAVLGEYANGVSAPKLSANMELYAMHMSSIFKSDVVKVGFAVLLVMIGVAVAYMVLHGNQQVVVKISPEALKQALNETAKNATKVIKV